MHTRKLAWATLAASVAMLALASREAWPVASKTIKIIVPYSAGGNTDTLARVLAEKIGRAQGATMVVENRPGASTDIGTEVASRAVPDGNTLLIVGAAFVVRAHLRSLSYDPLASFDPICHLTTTPHVIAVNGASPYRTLADLVSAARAKPGELTLAAVGPGSPGEIAFEMLKRAADVNMTFVPYPGNAPAVNALLGEHVTSVLADYTVLAEQLKTGKVRALATPSRRRVGPLPDVPTLAEAGYKEFEGLDFELPNLLFAPVRTPKETISKLAGWFTAAVQAPEVRRKLVDLGLYPVGICGADFAADVRKQYDDYGRFIRELNIKAE